MTARSTPSTAGQGQWLWVILAWALVGIPLLWGVLQTVRKATLLFG